MEKILVAYTYKRFAGTEDWVRTSNFVSFDRDKLKAKIEDFYKVKLTKNEENDFPYFTDGGFKYECEFNGGEFRTEAYLYDII